MHIKKIITVGLDITNIIKVFSNPEVNILNMIKSLYEKKCFNSSYINEVTRIIQYTDAIIDQERSNVFAKITVKFEVDAIVYVNGEVINGCEFIKKDKEDILICSTSNSSIWVNKGDYTNLLKIGQKISIRVNNVKYTNCSEKMAINANLFNYDFDIRTFYINKIDAESKQYILYMYEKLDNELDKKKEILSKDTKLYNLFEKILTPYKNLIPKPNNINTIDIKLPDDILDGKTPLNKYIYLNPKYINTDFKIYITDTLDPTLTHMDKIDSLTGYLSILEKYIEQLRNIREFVEIYNNNKLIEEHKSLFQIYASMKKD